MLPVSAPGNAPHIFESTAWSQTSVAWGLGFKGLVSMSCQMAVAPAESGRKHAACRQTGVAVLAEWLHLLVTKQGEHACQLVKKQKLPPMIVVQLLPVYNVFSFAGDSMLIFCHAGDCMLMFCPRVNFPLFRPRRVWIGKVGSCTSSTRHA